MARLTLGTAEIIKGDSRYLPLPDNSVDLVVTSPPYFALRSYQDGGEHYDGQIGAEPTPDEFVTALLEVTRECMRVLKPSGSIWVNLGDKYVADNRGIGGDKKSGEAKHAPAGPAGYPTGGMRQKSLMGLPWRYALRCIDDLGLILRAEVVWSKPNGLPESVTDRVRRSHEQWFHFTLEPRYFSAVDEIREAHIGGQTGLAATFARPKPSHDLVPGQTATQHRADREDVPAANPLGKLPGSVWTIPTEPLKVPAELGIDHFAAFPTEWPRRIINGWSPNGLCDECGEGRRPVVLKTKAPDRPGRVQKREVDAMTDAHGQDGRAGSRHVSEAVVTGYACACDEPTWPTHPAVVLDPFGGTGTTALVAKALGRHGISVDMSADYCRLAEWRTSDPKQIERVQNMQRYGIRNPTKKQIREHEKAVS